MSNDAVTQGGAWHSQKVMCSGDRGGVACRFTARNIKATGHSFTLLSVILFTVMAEYGAFNRNVKSASVLLIKQYCRLIALRM